MVDADTQQPQRIRAARQEVETSLLMGVDFVPTPTLASADDAATAKTNADERRAAAGAALETLRSRHDLECPHCTTAVGHTQTVFGEGDPAAGLMFIGEAPGEQEDRSGRPFVGRAGKKLDEIIGAMGFQRQQVYIANILKSRPPENRTPLPTEVAGCSPYLAEQIQIIRPAVIVALGGPSSKFLLHTSLGVTKLRGTWASYTDGDLSIPVMPTFHPAYLLRNYTPQTRQQVWSDMQQVMERLEAAAE